MDAVGNVYFLRAVHPFERVEMATVFSTYRDTAQVLPSAILAPLLRNYELGTLMAWSSLALLGLASLARRLPHRL
jgi:hypothetical protein